MAFQLTDSQQVDVTFQAVDKKGNPAPIDPNSPPVWATDNPNILALSPTPDGKTCTVKAVGVLGTAKVQLTVDADPSANVSNIIGILDVNVIGGSAVMVNLVPGTPTEQP
jgi:hypothetical protein